MAFLIALLIMLWFFGVTLFNFGPKAFLNSDTFLATIFSAGRYQVHVDGVVVEEAEKLVKSEAARACARAMEAYVGKEVVCTWRGAPLQVVGLLLP